MPRSFDMATDYDAAVEQVHAAFADERYWRARLADSGADEARLESMEVAGDGGVDVVTVQVLSQDRLPAVVSQFHRGDLEIRREERWSALVDSRAAATVAATIARAPVTLNGTAELTPVEALTRLALQATVEVRVPLVGGKLEKFIGAQLAQLLSAEQRFTTEWIAGKR